MKVYCQMDFVFLCCWHGDRLSIIIIGIIVSASSSIRKGPFSGSICYACVHLAIVRLLLRPHYALRSEQLIDHIIEFDY